MIVYLYIEEDRSNYTQHTEAFDTHKKAHDRYLEWEAEMGIQGDSDIAEAAERGLSANYYALRVQ